MLDQNENQCICILGEQAAGKTESARIILHYLTNANVDHDLSETQKSNPHQSTKLIRCKSLASYPKCESPERKSAIKCIRKPEVPTIYI